MLPSRRASWSAFLADIRAALEDPATHFFADTSFLLKAASLNVPARTVVLAWIDGIGPDRFHIPAWVGHETYRHLGKDNGAALTPMAKLAAELTAKLEELRMEARRFVDDDVSAGYQDASGAVGDRAAFLVAIDGEAASLMRRMRHLRAKAAGRLEETADFLADLINRHVMPAGSYGTLPTIGAEYEARLVGDHPPGQKDRKKELNKYGDLLTWREIVDYCAKEPRPVCVVLLTDDNKPDWVFRPPSVVDDRSDGRNERVVKNDGALGFPIILPQPLLTHELAAGRPDFRFHIVNLAMLARVTADQPDMRDLAHAYSAVIIERPAAEEEEPLAIVEVAASPAATALPQEQEASDLLDIDRAADAVAAFAVILEEGDLQAPAARAIGRAVVEAAEAGLETVELFGRSILTGARVHESVKTAVLEGMLLGAYLREDGQLRPRPLRLLIDGLFGAAARPEAQPAVSRLLGEVGAERRKFLLLPGEEGRAALNISLRRRVSGTGRLDAVMFGDVPLLVDGRRGAPNSLAVLSGGLSEDSAGGFRRLVADYFAVPEERVEMNLALADRISWDQIQCLVNWGTDIDGRLR